MPSHLCYDRDGGKVTDAPDQIRSNLQTLYDSGKPLFTKDALQKIADALDRIVAERRWCEKIPITDIEGVAVRFCLAEHEKDRDEDAAMGARRPWVWTWILGGLGSQALQQIFLETEYHTISALLEYAPTEPELAYQPIRVFRYSYLMDTSTLPPPKKLESLFRSHQRDFLQSATYTRLKTIFAGEAGVAVPAGITKVVAFACGSMAMPYCRVWGPPRSAAQHALALAVRDLVAGVEVESGDSDEEDTAVGWLGWMASWLGMGMSNDNEKGKEDEEKRKTAREKVPCYAQDPAYEDADTTVLESNGITVLPDPRGLLGVDESSVVVAFRPQFPLRQIVADIARPAVLIWLGKSTKEGFDEDCAEFADAASTRVREMMQGYVKVDCPFPQTLFDDDTGVLTMILGFTSERTDFFDRVG